MCHRWWSDFYYLIVVLRLYFKIEQILFAPTRGEGAAHFCPTAHGGKCDRRLPSALFKQISATQLVGPWNALRLGYSHQFNGFYYFHCQYRYKINFTKQ